jgi:glycosyltransferase involved in cell wall biosynthesis
LGSTAPLDGRKEYLISPQTENSSLKGVSRINLIPFSYSDMSKKHPYVISDMTPSIFEVIEKNNIDLVVTAASGYTEYPFNLIRDIPILLINIFGSPNVQKNIVKNICISYEVAAKISPIVYNKNIEVMYIQSEGPDSLAAARGAELRKKFDIPDSALVFGRIGRADDAIFDPIGINAFMQIVETHPEAHYLIMSPPPVLMTLVRDNKIPRVHFLPPSSNELDIWAFHAAIDVLAHFRLDGESCGLNIIEAMLSGKPIITHRSHIWNAQMEYLEPSFSDVTVQNDSATYAQYMIKYIDAKKSGQITEMGNIARSKATQLFLISNTISQFGSWIDEAIHDFKK